jgi:hypothetical protein
MNEDTLKLQEQCAKGGTVWYGGEWHDACEALGTHAGEIINAMGNLSHCVALLLNHKPPCCPPKYKVPEWNDLPVPVQDKIQKGHVSPKGKYKAELPEDSASGNLARTVASDGIAFMPSQTEDEERAFNDPAGWLMLGGGLTLVVAAPVVVAAAPAAAPTVVATVGTAASDAAPGVVIIVPAATRALAR